MDGITRYSDEIKGERRNYDWPVRYDMTDGFLRIVQKDGDRVKDCILLSPKQVKELGAFVEANTPRT